MKRNLVYILIALQKSLDYNDNKNYLLEFLLALYIVKIFNFIGYANNTCDNILRNE